MFNFENFVQDNAVKMTHSITRLTDQAGHVLSDKWKAPLDFEVHALGTVQNTFCLAHSILSPIISSPRKKTTKMYCTAC